MKPKKMLALFTLISSLILSACGGESTSSNKWDGSCGKCAYSKERTTESNSKDVVTKDSYVTNNALVKVGENVYFKIEGRCYGYQQEELKFAFGLFNKITEKFEYGSEAPGQNDFNVIATIDEATNIGELTSFTALLNISEISTLVGGNYQIYVGENVKKYQLITIKSPNFYDFDYRYEYYCRGDKDVNTVISISKLPPFNVTEVSVVSNPTNHRGNYLKLGGRQPENYTLDQLNNFVTLCDFQRIEPSYKKEPLTDYFFEVSGNKSYIYMSLAGMQAGETYMTHLSVTVNPDLTQAGKCLPLVDINSVNHVYPVAEDNLKFELWYSTQHTNLDGADRFFGALGIIVSECDIPID